MGVLILRSSVVQEPEPEEFDFYISTTGSDSNDGSLGSPWAITGLNTKRATYAGLRVGLLPGTYSAASFGSAYSTNVRLGIAPGSLGNITVVQSTTPRAAILDGGGTSELAAIGCEESDAGYITLKDITVQNCRKHSVIFIHTPNSSINQGLGLRVEGCEIKDQEQTSGSDFAPAVLIQGFDEPEFINNWVHDITSVESPTLAPAGMDMYACRWARIERCTFGPNCNFGYYDKYGSGGVEMQGTEIRQCYFIGNGVALVGFDNKPQTADPPDEGPYDPYIIENNVFEDVEAIFEDTGSFSADAPVIVRNNTIYRSTGSLRGFALHTRSAGREPSYYNNILVHNGASWGDWQALTISLNAGVAATGPVDYNLYAGSGPALSFVTNSGLGYPYAGGTSYTTRNFSYMQSTLGLEAGSLTSDPDFLMTGTGVDRFKLDPTSPAIDAGRVGGVSGGAAVDMGAWDGVVTQIGHVHP